MNGVAYTTSGAYSVRRAGASCLTTLIEKDGQAGSREQEFDLDTVYELRLWRVMDKKTDDAHDNPVISLDGDGHLWVFASSHGTSRPSYVFRSEKPYDIGAFERSLLVEQPLPTFLPLTPQAGS